MNRLGWKSVLASMISAVLMIAGIAAARTRYFTDDAAFFFRYAEHVAGGHGLRWNVSEAPIWGASAPLWPLCLAAPVRCGLSVESAAVGLGYGLSVLAVVLLTLAAARSAGLAAAIGVGVFCATDFKLCLWATQGMEAPLAYALAVGCIYATVAGSSWPIVGALAGLSLVHKLDFAPCGLLLLGATWARTGKPPWRAIVFALVIAAAWYGFAAWYFGSPLPNSFLTKLHAQYGAMPRTWFAKVALGDGARKGLFVLALLAVGALWKNKPLLLISGGFIVVVAAACTFKPPPEAFEWYAAPVQPVLCFLAALGTDALLRAASTRFGISNRRSWVPAACALVVVGGLAIAGEHRVRVSTKRWIDSVEHDRTEAGRWVDRNTPADARLATGYGNAAYYSHRYVYDWSYLNRRRPAVPEDIVGSYRPEVVVDCPFGSGVPPGEAKAFAGYRIAAVFDRAYQAGIDFYTVVMVADH